MSTPSKSLKQKLDELTQAVAWFDSDEFVLEQAVDRFKQAEKLAAAIEADLSALKNEVTVLKKNFDSKT